MATLTVTTGSDVQVRSDSGLGSTPLEGGRTLLLRGTDRYALLVMPVSVPAGRTVLSATLTGVARATFPAAGNITVQAIGAPWTPSTVKFSNQPALTGPTYSTAVPAVAAGGKFQLDVTALVQSIALGQANYGWRISTNIAGGISLMAFEEAGIQWQLDVVVSDAVAVPGGLSPQGKVSLAKWVARVDDYDLMAAMQVQVDADMVAPFDFDTGEAATTLPQLDLAALTAQGFTNPGADADLTGWAANLPNGTLARTTSTVRTGPGAFQLTSAAAGAVDMAPASSAYWEDVTPGATYTPGGYFRAATVGRACRIDIEWRRADLSIVSTTVGATATSTTAGWTLRTTTGVAPAGAVKARTRFIVETTGGAGEVHYVDDLSWQQGSPIWGGLADQAVSNWRTRVKTLDGQWSPWSDWVSVNRGAKSTMTVATPASGALYDPTPTVTASLAPSGGPATRWQVLVAKASDPTVILYDSGDDLIGATLSHTVPATWKGRKVMDVDTDYLITIRAWDDPQRVPSFGDPTYVQVVRAVTLDVDGTVNAPTNLTAVQNPPGSPRVKLTWDHGIMPDQFVVLRDGIKIAVVAAADVDVDANTYSYTDEGALPWEAHTYQVRAIEAGRKQSPNSNTVTITPEVTGVWLLTKYGDVLLYGDGIDSWRQDDKRVTFELPYHTEDVDIITAVGGMAGDYEGAIDNRGEQDVDWARGVLEKQRQAPHNPVRLIAATLSISAYLKGLSVSPASDIFPDQNRRHTVVFEFSETEDE